MSQRRSVSTTSSSAFRPGVIGYAIPNFSWSRREYASTWRASSITCVAA